MSSCCCCSCTEWHHFCTLFWFYLCKGNMATDCCECCCFFFLRHNRKEPEATTPNLYKHSSEERLLAFSVDQEDRLLTHSASQHDAKSTFNNYGLPSDNNASISTDFSKSMLLTMDPFKEWRGSWKFSQLDNTCENDTPHMLVKETHHVVRSEVWLFVFLQHKSPYCTYINLWVY